MDPTELERRVSRAAQHRNEEQGEASTSRSGLFSPCNDPVYSAINSKISAGCSCSSNCLSQFTPDEVFAFHLSLCEMTKVEKDMLKLQILSRTTDSTRHARQTKLGKRKRVTCDYCFDHRHICKDGFLFLHDMGIKQFKNLEASS